MKGLLCFSITFVFIRAKLFLPGSIVLLQKKNEKVGHVSNREYFVSRIAAEINVDPSQTIELEEV